MVLLPWLQEDLHRNPGTDKRPRFIADCRRCKTMLTREQRIMAGCGYEPPHPGVVPWQPPISQVGYKRRPLPTVCAGYLTQLPEVQEIARAHHWAEKGDLRSLCGKEEPSELLLLGIEILDGEVERVKLWALTDKKDGGGRG